MKKRIIVAFTVLYVVLITVLSLVKLSDKPQDLNILHLDKLVHFCFYFMLNFLLLTVVVIKHPRRHRNLLLAVTFVSILYSIAIEFVQIFFGRECSIWDVFANSMGAFLALLIFRSRSCFQHIEHFFKDDK